MVWLRRWIIYRMSRFHSLECVVWAMCLTGVLMAMYAIDQYLSYTVVQQKAFIPGSQNVRYSSDSPIDDNLVVLPGDELDKADRKEVQNPQEIDFDGQDDMEDELEEVELDENGHIKTFEEPVKGARVRKRPVIHEETDDESPIQRDEETDSDHGQRGGHRAGQLDPKPKQRQGDKPVEESNRLDPTLSTRVNIEHKQLSVLSETKQATSSHENVSVPGIMNKHKVHIIDRNPPKSRSPPYKLYAAVPGRFGNNLFQYASLYGIAKATGRIPIASYAMEVRETFLNTTVGSGHPPKDLKEIREINSGIFSPAVYNLPNEDVMLCCYLQSWKYFQEYEQDIRREYRFKHGATNRAKRTLINLATDRLRAIIESRTFPPGKKKPTGFSDFTYIGVQIRRGDYLQPEHIKKGYRPASASYIYKAMEYYRSQFENPLFIVASDDMEWSRLNVNASDAFFLPDDDYTTDMAVLAQCNHTVMTVGTFSWWAAWLAGGQVVYYASWPRPGSELATHVRHKDYFLPDWIPMHD